MSNLASKQELSVEFTDIDRQLFDPNSELTCVTSRITIPAECKEALKEEKDLLQEFLAKWLNNKTGKTILFWIQGSYKYGILNRPKYKEEFDVDLGAYVLWERSSEQGFSAHQLKRWCDEALQEYVQQNSNRIKEFTSKDRCGRLHYKKGFHIDVPIYHLEPSTDSRLLATPNGYEESDPKQLYLWFKDQASEEYRPQLRRMVRYLKTIASLRCGSSAPSSVSLMVLAGKYWNNNSSEAVCLLELLDACIQHFERTHEVLNPVDANENLLRLDSKDIVRWLGILRTSQETLRLAMRSPSPVASACLDSIFDHFAPSQTQTGNLAGCLYSISTPLIVSATVCSKETDRIVGRYEGEIGPIPKGCYINFQVTTPIWYPLAQMFAG